MKNILIISAFSLLLAVVSCKKEEKTIKEPQVTKLTVKKLLETSKSWNGDPLPKYLDGTPKITILRITIPPKTKLKLHKHPVINAGVLLKGELTVVSESGKVLNMKAGDSLAELVDKWHYGKNEGTEPAEIIVFYAGVEGTPITVLKK